jgi:hypothetical protein
MGKTRAGFCRVQRVLRVQRPSPGPAIASRWSPCRRLYGHLPTCPNGHIGGVANVQSRTHGPPCEGECRGPRRFQPPWPPSPYRTHRRPSHHGSTTPTVTAAGTTPTSLFSPPRWPRRSGTAPTNQFEHMSQGEIQDRLINLLHQSPMPSRTKRHQSQRQSRRSHRWMSSKPAKKPSYYISGCW